jgi:hypothetical protein
MRARWIVTAASLARHPDLPEEFVDELDGDGALASGPVAAAAGPGDL